jgi:hypothetical protein
MVDTSRIWEVTDGERVFWRGGRCTVWVGLDDHGIDYAFTCH